MEGSVPDSLDAYLERSGLLQRPQGRVHTTESNQAACIAAALDEHREIAQGGAVGEVASSGRVATWRSGNGQATRQVRDALDGGVVDHGQRQGEQLREIASGGGVVKGGLDRLANKLAMQTTKLHRRSAEIEEKQKELTDLDARKALLADEYSRLQTTVRHINDGSQQLSPAAPGKGKQALKDELTQASKPIVFVQFAGSLNRDATIKPLLQALNASGFNAPGAQRINKNQTNEVRYFANTDFERAAAAKVASIAQDTFAKLGCPLPTLTAKLVQREDGKTSPTELWLMHSCEAKP